VDVNHAETVASLRSALRLISFISHRDRSLVHSHGERSEAARPDRLPPVQIHCASFRPLARSSPRSRGSLRSPLERLVVSLRSTTGSSFALRPENI